MKQVLIPIHANTYFTGLLQVAISLKKLGGYEPNFLFCLSYPTLQNDLETCRRENIPFHFVKNGRLEHDNNAGNFNACMGMKQHSWKMPIFLLSSLKRIKSIMMRIVRNNFLSQIYFLYNQIKFIRKVINEYHILLVILPADNRYDQAAIVRAAHDESVPVVVVPQFMAGALEWAEYVWDKPEYSMKSWANRLAVALFPRWAYVHKGRKLIALPASQVFVRELFGIAPPLPWVLHSGYADGLAVESDAMRDYCISEELPSKKIYVTGSSTQDIISEIIPKMLEKRLELYIEYALPHDRPMLLVALPPNSIYMGRPECEFKEYDDLLKFWCYSLVAVKGYNVIFCLHPSVTMQERRRIEEFGLILVNKPTQELIPLCDIYVASISATIQWAIACGKPVLNYDVYRYRYTDYVGVGGVITVEDKCNFLNALEQLTSDANYYKEIVARQSICANRWGVLDGKAGNRLKDLFDNMIDMKKKDS